MESLVLKKEKGGFGDGADKLRRKGSKQLTPRIDPEYPI